MSTLYVLAHFDDEYFAWPLILRRAQAGETQYFLFVADYASAELSARRKAESTQLLATLGVPAERIVHAGAGTGALDGAVHRGFDRALAAVRAAAATVPDVREIVVTAWEGGHPDHDACAVMAMEIATERSTPVRQVSLYSGEGLSGRLFRAGRPLAQNGPVEKIRLGVGEWLRFLAGVRFYPSQAKTWLGLWPTMFLTYLLQGYGSQRLHPGRLAERPHPGALLYERMFGVPYDELERVSRESSSARPVRSAPSS